MYHSKIKTVLYVLMLFPLMESAHAQSSTLFESDAILELQLKGEMKSALKDRRDSSPFYQAALTYWEGTDTLNVPITIKTRGHFRRDVSNCRYPPLLLNFSKSESLDNTLWEDQKELKLVTPCQGDSYVINEYLVYKLYQLVTPNSFRARLAKVTYQDTVKNKVLDTYYSMLLEDDKKMAARNSYNLVKIKNLPPQSLPKEEFLKMAVFQYLIGNTDWSVQYLQNIKLISPDPKSMPFAVPYDFDHAGIVRAPYANPAPELLMSSTLERRYRGYCMEGMAELNEIFKMYNALKEDIYAIYQGNPLLDEKYQRETIKFLDEFFETINDPDKAAKAFGYPCDRKGTGNVVVKGLKKDN